MTENSRIFLSMKKQGVSSIISYSCVVEATTKFHFLQRLAKITNFKTMNNKKGKAAKRRAENPPVEPDVSVPKKGKGRGRKAVVDAGEDVASSSTVAAPSHAHNLRSRKSMVVEEKENDEEEVAVNSPEILPKPNSEEAENEVLIKHIKTLLDSLEKDCEPGVTLTVRQVPKLNYIKRQIVNANDSMETLAKLVDNWKEYEKNTSTVIKQTTEQYSCEKCHAIKLSDVLGTEMQKLRNANFVDAKACKCTFINVKPLTCFVCNMSYISRHPKRNECGHVFCEECLTDLHLCPICSAPISDRAQRIYI